MHKYDMYRVILLAYTVVSKPKIIGPLLSSTVTRPSLPITLSCEVDGDPNHYWVGWFHKTSIIKNGDDDHSVSVSQNVRSLQGSTHHLTVHSVKQDGKYQCLVFMIKDGSVVNQLTHQVKSVEYLILENCSKLHITSFEINSLKILSYYNLPMEVSMHMKSTYSTLTP